MSGDVWFYELGEQALGPYPTAQIVDALASGTFDIYTRISLDKQTWIAICNEKAIEEYIRKALDRAADAADVRPEIQSATGSGEVKEGTGSFNMNTVGLGISEQLKAAEHLTESNHNVTILRKLLSEILINRKKVVIVEEKPVRKIHSADADEIIEPKRKTQFFKNIFKDNRRTLFTTAGAVLVLGIIGFIARGIYVQHQLELQQQAEKARAEQAFQAKIISYYDQIILPHGAKPSLQDPKVLLSVSEVMTRKREYGASREVLQRMLNLNSAKTDRAKAFTLLAMNDLGQDDVEAANKNLEYAIKEDPNLGANYLSQGLVYLNNNQFNEAEPFFLKAMSLGENSATTYLALFEVAQKLETAQPGSAFERVKRIEPLLANYAQAHFRFRPEILIADFYSHALLKTSTDEIGRDFIDSNPETIADQKNRLLLYTHKPGWILPYSWCVNAFTLTTSSAVSSAVLAGCLIQIDKPTDAVNYAFAALTKMPGDPKIKGLMAYVLFRAGRDADAMSLLNSDPTLSRVGYLTMARLCEKQAKQDCATKNWNSLYELDKTDPSAYLALLTHFFNIGEYDKVKKMVLEGRDQQPYSEDLRKLAKQMKTKGIEFW
jgi:tetratricopeptide (TPR) repeat protein